MLKSSVKRMAQIMSASLAITLTGCGSDVAIDTDYKSIDVSAPVSDWKMVWNDEFDGDSINSFNWTHEVNCAGGGNQEQQCYTDTAENSFVADGMLNIVAKPSVNGEDLPYTSARLRTKNKGDWTYGRFEIRAKLPAGQGTWPAFWMLPTDEVYGSWPRSGEIDILEAVNLKADDNGAEERSINGQLYYGSGTANSNNQFDSSGRNFDLLDGSNPADDFHTYAIEWQEGEIRWYVDGYLYQTQRQSNIFFNSVGTPSLRHKGWYAEYFDQTTGELTDHWTAAPFDQDFHILLNLAVGGNWAANVNETGIDATAFAEGAAFQIDYVRVFECSINPLDGSGCETVRAGYNKEATEQDPTGALILGVAPTPPAPPTGIAIPITFFDDGEDPAWPFWDCCGGSTPAVVTDDAAHGAAVEFSVLNTAETVQGFNGRNAGSSYNGAEMLDSGTLSFELKIVTAPAASTPWILKIEADGNSSDTGDIDLSTSIEGLAPVAGDWQTFTFSVASLAAAGLDVSAIDVIMIFPAWGQGLGAVYRVDNLKITQPGGGNFPELVLFEDTANTAWPVWDCCAGSTPTEETDDAEHGTVVEFSVLGTPDTVQGFFGRDNGSFNATALETVGVLQFDMKVVTAPAGGTPWILKLEADGNSSDSGDILLNTSKEGLDPVTGEWQTYTFDMQTIAATGLDISAIDVVMIFPAWGQGAGAVYRIDNVKIYNPDAGSGPSAPSLTAFADAINPEWPLWDCCAGSTPTEQTGDAGHGAVAEFSVLGTPDTVQGFNGRMAGSSFNASALANSGTLSFDMKVVTAPAGGTPWILKIEADDNSSDTGDINLSTSKEGLAPVTGEWQTFTFDISTLAATNLDISAIDVIMIFPAWGQGAGAVYQIDNLVIGSQ